MSASHFRREPTIADGRGSIPRNGNQFLDFLSDVSRKPETGKAYTAPAFALRSIEVPLMRRLIDKLFDHRTEESKVSFPCELSMRMSIRSPSSTEQYALCMGPLSGKPQTASKTVRANKASNGGQLSRVHMEKKRPGISAGRKLEYKFCRDSYAAAPNPLSRLELCPNPPLRSVRS